MTDTNKPARALAADVLPEPAAWLVCSVNGDGSLMVEHSTAWEQAAHDHINDAINEHDIEDAATWVVRPAYTADQLHAAIAAERERNPSVQANLARGLLWLAFVWNDHNFEAAHKEARRIAERAGIRSFEDANAWLEAAHAGAGAKGEGE